MSPELLEALRFGLAILAGGLVALISAQLLAKDARRLDREHAAASELRSRRALTTEIRQNVEATRTENVRDGRRPFPRVRRAAWDAGLALPLTEDEFVAVATAYQAGDVYNAGVEMMVLGTAAGGRVHGELDILSKLAPEAHAAFARAQRLLESSKVRG